MRTKSNPLTIAANFARAFPPRDARREPAYVAAVTAAPPLAFLGHGAAPDLTGSFRALLPSRIPGRGNAAKTRAASIFKIPKIVYPEDEMRRAFYFHHPTELDRPLQLARTTQTKASNPPMLDRTRAPLRSAAPTTIGNGQNFAADFRSGNVSAESVVQYTLHLMRTHGMPRAAAYSRALDSFYNVRAAQQRALITTRTSLLSSVTLDHGASSRSLPIRNPPSKLHLVEQAHVDAATET